MADGPQKIYLKQDGSVLKTEQLGRGRYPENSYKDDQGNLIIPYPQEFVPHYLVISKDGEVKDLGPKGRGRPKTGFEKVSTGEHAGHWVKHEIA